MEAILANLWTVVFPFVSQVLTLVWQCFMAVLAFGLTSVAVPYLKMIVLSFLSDKQNKEVIHWAKVIVTEIINQKYLEGKVPTYEEVKALGITELQKVFVNLGLDKFGWNAADVAAHIDSAIAECAPEIIQVIEGAE